MSIHLFARSLHSVDLRSQLGHRIEIREYRDSLLRGTLKINPLGFPSPRLENMVPESRSEAHNYSSDRRPYILSTYHTFSALSGPNVQRHRSSRLTLTRQRKRPVYLILDIPPPHHFSLLCRSEHFPRVFSQRTYILILVV